jgi:hypothetical protein
VSLGILHIKHDVSRSCSLSTEVTRLWITTETNSNQLRFSGTKLFHALMHELPNVHLRKFTTTQIKNQTINQLINKSFNLSIMIFIMGRGFDLVVRAECWHHRRPRFESSTGTASIHLDVYPQRREHAWY